MKYFFYMMPIIIYILLFNEIFSLKKKLKNQEECINKLCKLTGHEELSSYWISDELKEFIIILKRNGKEIEAIKKIREKTKMSLIEAKQYVENLK